MIATHVERLIAAADLSDRAACCVLADQADDAGHEVAACWLRIRAGRHADSNGFRTVRGEGWYVLAYDGDEVDLQVGASNGIAQWLFRGGKWISYPSTSMTRAEAERLVRLAAGQAQAEFFRLSAGAR
jgi:hypothetical protein